MASIQLAAEIADDVDRIVDHLERHEVGQLEARISEIFSAVDVLRTNPLIGRLAYDDRRELVIGRGSHGYVALYRYAAAIDTVFVLALRAQREAGFARP